MFWFICVRIICTPRKSQSLVSQYARGCVHAKLLRMQTQQGVVNVAADTSRGLFRFVVPYRHVCQCLGEVVAELMSVSSLNLRLISSFPLHLPLSEERKLCNG